MTYLDELVPAAGNDHRVLRVGTESNARHPLGVAFISDGVLAISQSVPEFDASVAGG